MILTPDSYSVIDLSENDLEVVQNQKQIETKNAKNKRKTHRGRSNAPQQIRKKSTDKVAIGGFNIFYENYNIDKVCLKYTRKEGKPVAVSQTQAIKPTIEVKKAPTALKDMGNLLGGSGNNTLKQRKSVYVKPSLQ
jgi:hypothetical protein